MALNEIKPGIQQAGDSTPVTARGVRSGAAAVTDAHGRNYEATSRGTRFSLTLNTTSSTIAAGNIVAAGAAASTQFALWNPLGSGKNLSLLKFGMGVISGTLPAGPLFHGIILTAPTVASVGTVRSNLAGLSTGVAGFMASAAGAGLTGGSAPQLLDIADYNFTAGVAANVAGFKTVEYLDGSIVLSPGTGWVPLWSGAGATLLNAYSISWEEQQV